MFIRPRVQRVPGTRSSGGDPELTERTALSKCPQGSSTQWPTRRGSPTPNLEALRQNAGADAQGQTPSDASDTARSYSALL